MVRRGVAVVLVAALAGVVATAAPPQAQAFNGNGSPWSSLRASRSLSPYADELQSWLRGTNTTANTIYGAQSAPSQAQMSTWQYRARVAGRLLPRVLPIATRLTLVGTAGYIGYRVFQHFADSSTATVDTLLDAGVLGEDLLVNPLTVPNTYGVASGFMWSGVQWVKASGPTCAAAGVDDCFYLSLYPQYCSNLVWRAPGSCPGGTRYWVDFPGAAIETFDGVNGWTHRIADWDDCQTFAQITNCIGAGKPSQRQGLQWLLTRQAEVLTTGTVVANGTVTRTVTTPAFGTATSVPEYKILVPDTALGGDELDARPGTITGTPDVESDYNVPSGAGTTNTDIDGALSKLDTPCGRSFLNAFADPGRFSFPADCFTNPPINMAPPDVFGLPGPSVSGEGYSPYVLRIRDAGWEGTATKVVGAEVPELPPGAVVSVQGGSVWQTVLWPDPDPEIGSDDPLTITVNPGVFVSPDPVEPGTGPVLYPLPQPLVGETAAQYRLRLREQGHLGSITIVEADPGELPTMGQPQFNPNEPVIIRVGSPTRVTVEVASPWPDSPPSVQTDEPVEIAQAPTSAPPRSASDPTPVGQFGGSSSCDPWLEAEPDFGPLTGLDFGSNFPFGLFAWVGAALGAFNVTPDAPNWTFDMTIPATAVSPEYSLPDFTIDLEWADGYMATVRLILTFVLWIGAVWFFATALLGLRAPGNPAEAVDEA